MDKYRPNGVCHRIMTVENNFIYIGKRNRISSYGSKFRTFNGFIIEPNL